jgi:hypothetical protein
MLQKGEFCYRVNIDFRFWLSRFGSGFRIRDRDRIFGAVVISARLAFREGKF